MKGLGSGVFEIVERYDKNAFRLVYAVQIGTSLYVLHAFQKKSTRGIATPKPEIDLIKRRYKEAQEHAKNGQ
jgi:phage-related protein